MLNLQLSIKSARSYFTVVSKIGRHYSGTYWFYTNIVVLDMVPITMVRPRNKNRKNSQININISIPLLPPSI